MPAVVTCICSTAAAPVDLIFLPRNPNTKIVGFAFAQKNSKLTWRDVVSYAKTWYLILRDFAFYSERFLCKMSIKPEEIINQFLSKALEVCFISSFIASFYTVY